MPGLLNVTYRYSRVLVPHWIGLDGVILSRNESEGTHEVSFQQKETEVTESLLPSLPSVY